MSVVLLRQSKLSDFLRSVASAMLVFFGFAQLERFLVQQIIKSYVVLELLNNIVEDCFQSFLAFSTLFNHASVQVGVIVNASYVLKIFATFRLSEHDRNNVPGPIIFRVCEVLIFV